MSLASSTDTSLQKSVRFLVLSDTHDLVLNNVPDADVVLHCGDLTEICSAEGLQDSLIFLSSINAELRLVIAGNHDTLLDQEYVQTHGGESGSHEQAVKVMDEAPDITYLREGRHTFTLTNGASFSIYASPFTPSQYGPKYSLHAFQYASGEDRYNPVTGSDGKAITPSYAANTSIQSSTIPPGIDIVMTHGPPKYILDRPEDDSSAGCEHLRRAVCRTKPLMHCFGHMHNSYGAQRVAWRSSTSEDELEELGITPTGTEDDDALLLPRPEPDGVMKNSSRRRGYARIGEQAQKELVKGKQTLMLNAAIADGEGRPGNAPWLVELSLPIVPTTAGKKRKSSEADGDDSRKRHANRSTVSKADERLEEFA
ncbi:MAG: hypothetical protein M1821_001816 [Bathelium mastoideum]|nr:MAG: hypothetical protein M1821_001816 [Bathelium mastoideum]